MITLVISDNEGTTTRVPLVLDEVSIGRKEGNTIRLTERNISREHCRIARVNGDYIVRDLGSYNGVIVNGKRVDGEHAIKPGDEVRIGDYTVGIESEARAEAAPATERVVSQAPPRASQPARLPCRLLVLTPPLAGAEFTLPDNGQVRVGRAPDLEVAIDHRSVSREHALIGIEEGRVRILDRDSANGVVVNQEKVLEATLAAGDIVELGDVLLRFVGAGEQYAFDPKEAAALIALRRRRPRMQLWLAGGIVGAALVAALMIIASPSKPPHPAEFTPEPASAALAKRTPQAAVAAAAAPEAEPDHFPELLQACRDAVAGGRFAEGVAHATAALKLRPDAPDALECQATARARHEQEQIYVRGAAALEAGDVEGAWNELQGLEIGGAVEQRPEVAQSLEAVANRLVDRAEHLARHDPVAAGALARSVVERSTLPAAVRNRARQLLVKLEHAPAPRASRGAPASSPKAVQHTRPASTSSGQAPMQIASACLAHGDNQCVIRALAGRAQTAQELGLLIETYRAVGESALAYRNMATYVQRFPTARRAETYRSMLARQGE